MCDNCQPNLYLVVINNGIHMLKSKVTKINIIDAFLIIYMTSLKYVHLQHFKYSWHFYEFTLEHTKMKQLNESLHGKTNNLHMRKQKRRSAVQKLSADQRLCFHTDSTIPLLLISEISSF